MEKKHTSSKHHRVPNFTETEVAVNSKHKLSKDNNNKLLLWLIPWPGTKREHVWLKKTSDLNKKT